MQNTISPRLADVLTKLKIGFPNLDSVFYRQDNAGCYHCGASTILGAKVLADKAKQHIQCGKHKRALEQETLLDRAMLKYAYELEKGGSKVVELCGVACPRKETNCQVPNLPLTMGWALKSSFTRKTRFISTQRDYLQKEI